MLKALSCQKQYYGLMPDVSHDKSFHLCVVSAACSIWLNHTRISPAEATSTSDSDDENTFMFLFKWNFSSAAINSPSTLLWGRSLSGPSLWQAVSLCAFPVALPLPSNMSLQLSALNSIFHESGIGTNCLKHCSGRLSGSVPLISDGELISRQKKSCDPCSSTLWASSNKGRLN